MTQSGGEPGRLAVVIGTCDRLDQLKACLNSIRAESRLPLELWVTDAGSEDGTVAWLTAEAAADPRIHPVFEGEKRGQARALNAVFSRLTTPYVCWLSDDNMVTGQGLDTAVAALQADPALGMVGLKVRDLRGPFADQPYIGGITGTGVINVNQGVLPTPLLQQLGGFDETFRDYGIDADLTTRVLLAGRDVAFTRAVAVLHQRNWAEEGTPEGQKLEARNQRYRTLYRETFGTCLGKGWGWLLTRALWKGLRILGGRRLALSQPRPVLGFLPKDWHNMIAGRFVRLTRELRHHDAPVHLRQHMPVRLCRRRPARVPRGAATTTDPTGGTPS